MKRAILFSIIFLFAFLLNAEESILKTKERYVYLLKNGEYIQFNKIERVIKNYSAKKRYAEYKVTYNSVNDSVAIVNAYTINDKDTIKVTPKEINIITAPDASGYPDYDNIKMKVINFPAVKEGSTIYIEYALYRKKSIDNSFIYVFGDESFTEDVYLYIYYNSKMTPYIRELSGQKYKVSEISRKNIKYIKEMEELFGIKIEKLNTYLYAENHNIRSLDNESGMPPIYYLHPSICFSEYKTWYDLLVNIEERGDLSDSLFEKIKNLPQVKKLGIIDGLYDYILSNFNVVGIPIVYQTNGSRMPENVFVSKYGTLYDIVNLFYNVLKRDGKDVYFFVTMSKRNLDDSIAIKFPSLKYFDKIGIMVKNGGREILYDFNSIYNNANTIENANMPVIIFNPLETAKNKQIYFKGIWDKTDENRTSISENIKIDKKMHKIDVKYIKQTKGKNVNTERSQYYDKKGKKLELQYEQTLNYLYSGYKYFKHKPTIKGLNKRSGVISEEYSFVCEGIPVEMKGNYYALPLRMVDIFIFNTEENRKEPYRIYDYNTQIKKITVELPKNINIIKLPISVNYKCKYFKWTRTVEREKNKIIVKEQYEEYPSIIPVKELVKIREELKGIVSSNSENLLIMKKK